MKSRMNLFLVMLLLIFFIACEEKFLKGKVDTIEYDRIQVENKPPMKRSGFGSYGSWEEAYADGWGKDPWDSIYSSNKRYETISKPTGFIIVELIDGKKIRCKNPFPDISYNQEVKIKETGSGDWVITQ